MSSVAVPEQQYLLLYDVNWDDYRTFERIADRQPGGRLTFDQGRLEFMTLSFLHEQLKTLIDRLLFAMVEEFDVPVASAGSTTFRREDLERGLEPDQCYYLDNEPLVRGKDELDLAVDPPPDLVIEIEISRSVLDRLAIFASMGVPGVWRADGEQVHFLRLSEIGEYEEHPESHHFPGVRSEEMASFLRQRKELDERALVKLFREWVQTTRAK